MHINRKTLYTLAHLARLELEPEHEVQLLEDLNNILYWADQLQEADIDASWAEDSLSDAEASLRDDVAGEALPQSTLLKNAPVCQGAYITVPLQVIKKKPYED